MMKKQMMVWALSIMSLGLSAQGKFGTDSVKCWENTQIYYQMYKSKQYASAYDSWLYVYENCPQAYKNTFIFAPKIIEDKMKQANEPAMNEKLVAQLLESYDKRLEYFPGNEAYVYGNKGIDLMKYRKDDAQAAYDAFMKAYEADPDNLPAAVLNGIFISAARLYNSKEFTIEQVFETYNLVSEAIQRATDNIYIKEGEYATKLETGAQLDAKEAKDTAALKRELYRFDVVNGNVEKTLAPIATCEKLQLLYNQETFIENKSDADWLRRASKMLSKERRNEEGEMEDCTDLPIFFVIAEENYKLEPSPISARAVGKLAWSRKDYAKAVEYFKEAAESEVDPNKKADDYLKVAISHQKLGQLSSAKTNSLKAASLRKKWGDPYVLIATLYGASEGIWGSNVVEKKAVYWAAIDKLKYAKSIDSDVTNKSNRLIEAYEKQLPDKSVAFQLAKKDGDRICIGSWINECVIAKF
jgi:tetratricopeptide (TPR) repeat protein